MVGGLELREDRSPVATGIGPVPIPVLHIHASSKCNLSCAHCYSRSSPSAAGAVPVQAVCQLIDDAADLGYRAVAFSGGEPLIYPGLMEALSAAKTLGLRASVTSNGTLLDPPRLEALHDLVTLLAVSLDGPPALHNEIRGSASAFDRLLGGVENLRSADIRFGLLHTLTRYSWEHLPWLADFAHGNGAKLFQIHPLEMFGRAERMMRGQMPDENVLMRAYLLSHALLVKYREHMAIQIDLVHRDQALRDPTRFYAKAVGCGEVGKAADLLSVVVLEPDGAVVPLAYGFSRRFMICNIHEERFASAWRRYAETDYPVLRRLCRAALDAIRSAATPQLFNWHDLIVQQSLCWPDRIKSGKTPSVAATRLHSVEAQAL
jgi:MoaA/NifB/PqqE/SkfB family radical SAM enzyme